MFAKLLQERIAQELNRRSITIAHIAFDEFVKRTYAEYQFHWYHRRLIKALEAFAHKEIRRLIVSLPPRHGKSELTSVRLPPYIFGMFPDSQIISCSYSASLASTNNRKVQRVMDAAAYRKLFPTVRLGTKRDFEVRNTHVLEIVGYKGKYLSAGIGGGITGEGADYAIIDDPVKNRKEANSRVYQEATYEWYKSVLRTRLLKEGSILVTATRWHEDDLTGKILEGSKEDWTVINIPAIADSNLVKGVNDPREDGEALWPNHFPIEELHNLREDLGPYDFNALYQGDPTSDINTIFRPGWWQLYELVSNIDDVMRNKFLEIRQSWDTALKDEEVNDYSVCETWGVAENGYFLLHRLKERLQYPELKAKMISLAEHWKPARILIEDKASGISALQELQKTTSLPLLPIQPRGDKVVRAKAVTGVLEAGKVFLPYNAPWLRDFIEEHRKFPNAKHDDQVDATTQFLQDAIMRTPSSLIDLSSFGR